MASNPPNNFLPSIPNADSSANDLFAFHRMMSYQHLLAAQQLINYLYPNQSKNNELLTKLLTNQMANGPVNNALMMMPLGNQMTIGTAMFGSNFGIPQLPTTSSTIPDLIAPSTSGIGNLNVDSTFSNMDVLQDKKTEKQLLPYITRKFTTAQVDSLQKLFLKNPMPSTAECEFLATEIGLTSLQVRNWCEKRRRYMKKKAPQLNFNCLTRSSVLSNSDNANMDSTFSQYNTEQERQIFQKYGFSKFTACQRETLTKHFSNNQSLCSAQRKVIEEETGLTGRQIRSWYQNRKSYLLNKEKKRLVKEKEQSALLNV